MKSFAPVFMFVERSAVETDEPVLVVREMGRNPIDDNAKVCRMAGIDKPAKLFRLAVTARWREQTERLIAP